MNLYNIFEGLDPKNIPTTKVVGNNKSDEELRKYANDTAAMAKGEIVNQSPRMFPNPNRPDPKMGMQEDDITEFAQGDNNGGGNYLLALASAWYNDTFNTGSLQKGIKSQQDVERVLARGIHCADGKVRKYHIDYNSDFDGVMITTPDFYEYDAGGIDERTGQPWSQYDYIEFGDDDLNESVTEDSPVEIDEAAMNPSAFAQAIKTGQEKGVLVGFEFETCIPKTSIERWKTGDQTQDPEVPRYDAESTAWVDGKTTDDLLAGIMAKANGRVESVFDDLFKYKGSVTTQLGFKNPWNHYRQWVATQVNQRTEGMDSAKIVFAKLAEFLKDPEIKAMEVNYMSDNVLRDFGAPENWNGRTFTIEILKRMTGVDFGKRVPKSALTPELAQKVQEACHKAYQITRNPYDGRINAVGNALATQRREIEAEYYPSGHNIESSPERLARAQQFFAEFNQETMGTNDLKELLKKKWAFRGRVNNATPVLKEKLWYYVTPNAPMPASLTPRSYGRSDYREGAEFLKANLKDVYGENMEIFTGYHQATKKLDRWYIEPDGSLRANGDDSTAEVVSPPLPAAEAMTALRTWYDKAQQLKLYTNGSTGLHINVSIPGNLDVLKLATFVGDQYVLKKFGRENNSYARSVINNLKGNGQLPTLGSAEFKDAEREMKEIVKRISGDHFATVNFNGKYVSFRHAGGDYLNKGTDIANTVGRFVRAMIIASDPQAYRDEYVGKLVKLMKSPGAETEKMALSDIRQVAAKGIPTVNLDVIVRPRDPSAPTAQDVTDALESIRRWARDQYSLDPVITPDPSAKERLLADRGFASSSKEWIDQAPEQMFFQVTVIPNTRRKLENFADRYSSDGNQRGAAFSLYYDGKRATAIKYNQLIKQDNPKFVEVIQALRGGAAKPLPLPGAKGTPSTAAATFASQRPADQQTQEPERTDVQRNGQRRDWIIYNPENNPNGANPAHGIRANNLNTTEIVDRVHEVEARSGLARGTLRVRYADEDQNAQSQDDSYTFVDSETGEVVRQGDGLHIDAAIDTALELANHHGVAIDIYQGNEVVDRIQPGDEENQEIDMDGHSDQTERQGMYRPLANDDLEQTYNIINTSDGDQIQHYHGTLADTRRIAQARANQMGVTIGVEDQDGDAFGYFDPEQTQQPESVNSYFWRFMNPSNQNVIDSFRSGDEDAMRQLAQSYANRANAPIALTRDGRPFELVEPQELDEGITSPGGSTTNDSTSPVGGGGSSTQEVDYDDDYQDMVKRVGQKARQQEKRKPVDLAQLAKRLREDARPMSTASRELLRVARQSNPEAMSDTDAIYGYLGSIARKTQDNYKQVNNILRQLDPLSTELDSTERELGNVERVNAQQQELLRRLSQRVDQVRGQTLPSQQRAADTTAQQAAAQGEKERAAVTKQLDQPQTVIQQPQQVVEPQSADVADTKARQDIEAVNKHIQDLERKMYAKDTTDRAKAGIIRDLNKMKSTVGAANPDKIRDLARSLHMTDQEQQELPFNEEEMYESHLYALKKAGYDIL